MVKARASGSKVYLYFIKKGRQARHRIPRYSCFFPSNIVTQTRLLCLESEVVNIVDSYQFAPVGVIKVKNT